MPRRKPRTSAHTKHPVTVHNQLPAITREQLPSGNYRYRQDEAVHTAKSRRLYTHASAYRMTAATTHRHAGVSADLAVGDVVVFLHSRADIATKGSSDGNRIPGWVRIPGAIEITEYTHTTQKEGTMPRKPKSTATTTTTATEAPATAASNGKPKAPAFTLTKRDAQAVAKRLRDGETMKTIREEYGHSDGSKVRAALRAHGIGSKGQPNPDGLTPTEWNAKHGTATKAKPATKATKAAPAKAEEPEEEEEETEAVAPKAKLTPAQRKAKRAEYRRNRRAAKAAEAQAAAAPAATTARKRTRKPKAAAADPSQAA